MIKMKKGIKTYEDFKGYIAFTSKGNFNLARSKTYQLKHGRNTEYTCGT